MSLYFADSLGFTLLLLGFFIVLIASNQIAVFFQRFQLPFISGLLFTGIIVGPYILNLIPIQISQKLIFVNDIALSFIAFVAGSELYLDELKSRFKSIKWNSFGQIVMPFVLNIVILYLLSKYIPFFNGLDTITILAVSAVITCIFLIPSPPCVIGVINELKAKGPFTQTILGVIVIKDFIVIILFSVCLSVAQTVIKGMDFDLLSLLILIAELGVSFVLGYYFFGNMLNFALSLKTKKIIKNIVILIIGYSVYFFSNLISEFSEVWIGKKIFLEPILMCILASFYITNYSKYRAEFLNILHELAPYIYILFFTFIGASLNIFLIKDVIGIALMLLAIRFFSIIIGSYTGGYLAKDPMKYRHVNGLTHISQAGVALGLATVVIKQFPEFGEDFATSIKTLIILNLMIGPTLIKIAILKVGEQRIAKVNRYENLKICFIIGFEPSAFALAQHLKENNWNPKIIAIREKSKIDEANDIPILNIKSLSEEEFKSIEIHKATGVICLLSDSENFIITSLLYDKFNIRNIVVRLNDRNNAEKFIPYEVKIVDPSTAIVNLIGHFIHSPEATSLLLGLEKDNNARDIKILNKNINGMYLRDLRLPAGVIILSVKRSGQTIISHGYTRLKTNDIVTLVGSNKSLDEVQFKFDK